MNDLLDIVEEKTARITILKPDGTPLLGADDKPWWIQVAGPSHRQAFVAQNQMVARAVRARRENRNEIGEPEDYVEHLVTRTLDWGPITWGGKPFAFSPENAEALYLQSALVREQIEVAFNSPSNFRKKPLTN